MQRELQLRRSPASGVSDSTSKWFRCGAEMPYDNSLRAAGYIPAATSHYRAYGAAQLSRSSDYRGWFFWSYRTETTPAWSFRECVERGWLPQTLPLRGGDARFAVAAVGTSVFRYS